MCPILNPWRAKHKCFIRVIRRILFFVECQFEVREEKKKKESTGIFTYSRVVGGARLRALLPLFGRSLRPYGATGSEYTAMTRL